MKILRLKELLKEKDISGKEFAGLVEVTEASISNLVKGESIPRKDLLLKIASVLNVDVRDLFVSTKQDKTAVDLLNDVRAKLDEIESKL